MTPDASFQRKAIIRTAITCAVVTAFLFGSAGTLAWWNGWLFIFAYSTLVVSLTGFFTKNQDLVKERVVAEKAAKWWDKVLFALIAAVLPLVSVLLAGLDKRFGWTADLGTVVSLSAFLVMVLSNALTFWAMRTNQFFSSHVRIQTDRGHQVVTDGPYKIVRHPGYVGAIGFNLAAPVVLGSLIAVWVGIAMMLLLILRTALEDKTLKNELPGYREYAERVRFRLIPGVW